MDSLDQSQNRKLTEDRENKVTWNANVRLFEPSTILNKEISFRFVTWQLAVILN
jgi:hypothetical protein